MEFTDGWEVLGKNPFHGEEGGGGRERGDGYFWTIYTFINTASC